MIGRRCGLRRDLGGVVGVELALVGGIVLIPMIFGAYDIATIVRTQSRLDQTLDGALMYAWANGGSVTTANVQANAAAAFGAGSPQPSVIATINQYCIAPATGYPASGTPASPVNGSCANGTALQSYLSVTSSVSVSPAFLLSYLSNPLTLSVSGHARIE